MMTRTTIALLAANLLLAFPFSGLPTPRQSRDHLTPQEVDLVKEAQILDQRIDVFIKAADRRLLVLRAGDAGGAKQLKKDSEKWGELPTGTQAELISDIANILDEAITNIDDVSTRDERNPLIQKALRKLATATTRIVDQLKPLRAEAKGDAQIGSFEQLMENAESIVQAASRLPPPAEKKEKGKGEKSKDKN
jgi:hypothetical protein